MSYNKFEKYIKDVCYGIDAVRADLWDTALEPERQPCDNHKATAERQSARAEIWAAIMDYREERIGFSELLMSLQAFDPKVTPDGIIKLLGRNYYG